METISVAGLAMENQAFGAIDRTDNVAIRFGASGIFGLGFPSGSKIQQAVVTNEVRLLNSRIHVRTELPAYS